MRPTTNRDPILSKLEFTYLDFPRIRFHDLRHSHATQLLASGVHPKIVQERLGHSTIAVTMDIYSHVTPGLQGEAVAKLALAFGDHFRDQYSQMSESVRTKMQVLSASWKGGRVV
ncbi:MAG: tyrosine-type recombinase/integrase [Xanthobacteraceae bacterium]